MQLEQLGPYRLSRRLGRGGMGTVFEGLNVETAQPAAVKVLNPHLAVEEGFRERFEIEIETLKKLKHPNIVRLYGFGQQDGVIFYAMELVHGTNLEDELQAGRRFNWRETTSLGIKLARALQHAHDHGVVHRDLKPANLLITPEGDVKLADFGIARLFGNTRLTSAGGLVGTAEYMAPEQADGRAITPQCDLYSLGGVLFAMLAGRPPFSGASLPEVLQLHRFALPPPVSRFAPDVPSELAEIIARLLSKDPVARGTNARFVAKQLSAMEHALSLPREEGTRGQGSGARDEERNEGRGHSDLDGDTTLPGELAPSAAHTLAPGESAADSAADSAIDLRPQDSPSARAKLPPTMIAAPHAQGAGPFLAPAPPSGPSLRVEDGALTSSSLSPPAHRRRDPDGAAPAMQASGQDSSAISPPREHPLTPRPDSLTPEPWPLAPSFITVEEDERRRAAAEESARSPAWLQIALLSLALAMLVGFGFYLMRPPSADALYARIEATIGSAAGPERLLDAEDDIHKFLVRFPDDPRSKQLISYTDEIDLLHLERQMELRPRVATGGAVEAPIERDYAEAIRNAASDPEHAAAKLQAIVDFYGPAPGRTETQSETTSRFLELSRRQLVRLIQKISKQAPADLKLIDANLARAEQLRTTDSERARAIWSSIIELYSGKPWAADRVAKARAALNAGPQ
jgi:eukaryotic-like serine/threonine-protein kinase